MCIRTLIAVRFEIRNEPRLSPTNYEPYAKLAATACVAIHKGWQRSKGQGSPHMFFGTLSGGYAGWGAQFLNGTLPILANHIPPKSPTRQKNYHQYVVDVWRLLICFVT